MDSRRGGSARRRPRLGCHGLLEPRGRTASAGRRIFELGLLLLQALVRARMGRDELPEEAGLRRLATALLHRLEEIAQAARIVAGPCSVLEADDVRLAFLDTTESLEEDDVNGLVRHDIHQRRIHGHIRDGSPDSGDEARADPRRRRAESLADRGLLLSLEGL